MTQVWWAMATETVCVYAVVICQVEKEHEGPLTSCLCVLLSVRVMLMMVSF